MAISETLSYEFGRGNKTAAITVREAIPSASLTSDRAPSACLTHSSYLPRGLLTLCPVPKPWFSPTVPLPPRKKHLQAFCHCLHMFLIPNPTFWPNCPPEFQANKHPASSMRHPHLRCHGQKPAVLSHPANPRIPASASDGGPAPPHLSPTWTLVLTSPPFTPTAPILASHPLPPPPRQLHPSPLAPCLSHCLW